MDMLVYAIYPLLAVALFWGAKAYGIKSWNDEFLSLKQTKALQGFCAICIMLHHCGQKTCMPGMKEKFVRHGLDPFVPIGYFFVAIFLFCSGYGLYKSYKTKDKYLRGFPKRKLVPVLFALLVSSFFFAIARVACNESLWFTNPFNLGNPNTFNPYAWYVYAFLVFNLLFWAAFGIFKNEKVAIFTILIGTILYMLHCDYWMYGNWWINTALLFVIGIMVARHEEGLIAHIKKFYFVYIILALALTVVCFAFGEYTTELLTKMNAADNLTTIRLVRLFAQILAAIFFTITVLLVGMKVRIGNKFLAHMGTITLEFYLIHGLFVQGFGYAFLVEAFEPLYYIKNVALYVAVVFAISVAFCTLLHKVDKIALDWLDEKDYIDLVFVSIRNILIVLIPLTIIFTIFCSVKSHNKTKDMAETVNQYKDEYITYVEVDGKQMATYVVGEGNHTIVIMQDLGDYCPTITMRGLADVLSQHYKVVVLDYLGNGFSEGTDKERTVDAFVSEIHEALTALGIDGKYILMPRGISGLYAYKYINTYPDEVEALIGMDAVCPNAFTAEMKMYNSRIEDVMRNLDKQGKVQANKKNRLVATGFIRFVTPQFADCLRTDRSEKDIEILDEVIIENSASETLANEIYHMYDNYCEMENWTIPEDLPVNFILDRVTDEERLYYRLSWRDMYADMITNTDIQKIDYVQGNSYLFYYDASTVAKRTTNFIKEHLDAE